jgi:hypothetical protein
MAGRELFLQAGYSAAAIGVTFLDEKGLNEVKQAGYAVPWRCIVIA